ncbi:MAG TPA: hypothetical protein VGC57_11395 [Cellulomonas sp.]
MEDLMRGGVDPDPVLVPIAEKEQLGYDQPSAEFNPSLQRKALEHQEQIFAVVRPQVEEAIGRTVELTRISADYPDRAVTVQFRTVDEPVVAWHTVIGLQEDGSAKPYAAIERIEGVEMYTVHGLYRMAYRDRFTRMREYLLTTYPQFTVLPDEYVRTHRMADPMFDTSFLSGPWEEAAADRAAEDAIYQAYLADPVRTDAEWRALFEEVASDRLISLTVHLVLADPAVELTEEVSRTIAEDVRTNPLFPGTTAWCVFTYSNLVVRDLDFFHQQYTLSTGLMGESDTGWDVQLDLDGGTQK